MSCSKQRLHQKVRSRGSSVPHWMQVTLGVPPASKDAVEACGDSGSKGSGGAAGRRTHSEWLRTETLRHEPGEAEQQDRQRQQRDPPEPDVQEIQDRQDEGDRDQKLAQAQPEIA